jgi:phenylacetate-CoA ligase
VVSAPLLANFRRAASDALLLDAFRRAASEVPAYRSLLAESGVNPSEIVDRDTFVDRCPILTKANTFDCFPIDQLCANGAMRDLAGVLTSSGHGGRFSFGLSTRQQEAESAEAIDHALDEAFGVKTRRTLAINCLPMGVTFSSRAMTVATTSVREDMAVALVKTFGSHYDQLLIVSDPLFVRRLLDHARQQGVDWREHRVSVVLGEEIFGEHFRSYVAGQLGLDLDRPDSGDIVSSFGVGELGLHLCYETPATIALRRAAHDRPMLALDLFGEYGGLPMILTYNPERTLVESVATDHYGFGRLTISMLDTSLPIPLMRYQTGDVVRLMDRARVESILRDHDVTLPGPLPDAMLALRGRDKERLPDGSHVARYKDALYADPLVADRLTGAFRVTPTGVGPRVQVQLVRGAQHDSAFERRLQAVLHQVAPGAGVTVSPYESFPYGMGLDYERKFAYVEPAIAS